MEPQRLNNHTKFKYWIPAIIFSIPVIFAGGITFQKGQATGESLDKHLTDVKEAYTRLATVEQAQAVMSSELTQMKEILKDIRKELQEANKRRK